MVDGYCLIHGALFFFARRFQNRQVRQVKPGFHLRRKHKHKSFMLSENERDASTSTRKRKYFSLVLLLTSRPFSR